MDEPIRYDVRNYPPRQDSVQAARRRAAWLAVAWGQPGLASDVALLTSELTTNALLHGSVWDRYLRVEVGLTGAVLRIAVSDPKGERRPELRAAGDDEQYGRGCRSCVRSRSGGASPSGSSARPSGPSWRSRTQRPTPEVDQ